MFLPAAKMRNDEYDAKAKRSKNSLTKTNIKKASNEYIKEFQANVIIKLSNAW